jgi:hypothetical protein
VLRDNWLAHDDEARAEVVTILQGFGLGDATLAVGDAQRELTYLGSCRNGRTLRGVALNAFIGLGEVAAAPTGARSKGSNWDQFEATLAKTLAGMAKGQFLILTVRGSGVPDADATTGSSYYIQLAMGGDEGVRIETVANAYLTRYERFSQESQLRLVELGWQPPTRLPGEAPDDPSGSPNYFHDYSVPTPFDEVAATTVKTLRQIHQAKTPAVLEYLAFWTTGSPIELPDLEIDEEKRKPSPEVGDIESMLPNPASPGELRLEVARVLASALGDGGVEYDDNGDIPIRFGSTNLCVRTHNEVPWCERSRG